MPTNNNYIHRSNRVICVFTPFSPVFQIQQFQGHRDIDLRDIRDVVYPRLLHDVPDRGAGVQLEAPAVCVRGQACHVLGVQLLLGPGTLELTLHLT